MKCNAVVFGPIGSGKSYCIRTLLKEYPDEYGKMHKGAGLNVLSIACEAGWEATNGDLSCEIGYHVCQVLPATPTWEQMIDWIDRTNTMNSEAVKTMTIPGSIKNGYMQWMDLLKACINFKCDRCGTEFGPLDNLDDNYAVVTDGLTGITKMATDVIVGPKPSLTWPDIDRVGHIIEDFVGKFVSFKASYVLIAHWAREPKQVEGGSNITIHTIGQKLAPRLLLDTFDEVILAEREGTKYTWNMAAGDGVDQKARRLEYKAGLPPDFSQIFRQKP